MRYRLAAIVLAAFAITAIIGTTDDLLVLLGVWLLLAAVAIVVVVRARSATRQR